MITSNILPIKNGSSLKIGIVRARWHDRYTSSLLRGCKKALRVCGVLNKNVIVLDVPGSYETVYGAKHLMETTEVDVIICLGVLIKGETMHFEYISSSVAQGIMELNVDERAPVIFGILTCLDEKQVRARTIGKDNHGYGWGVSAVEMGLLGKSKVKNTKL